MSQERETRSIAQSRPAPSRNVAFTASILLVILLGTALRLHDLGAESYWFDEVYTVHMAQRSVDQLLAVNELDWPPVYFVLIHYWVRLLGTTEMATRLFSAVAGIVSIALTYLVGCELFGKNVGLLSALLIAVSEFQIYYSQETRFYSLFLLATLVSFFFFIRALRYGRTGYFFLYGMSSILLFYCDAFGVFVIAAQNLYFLLRWSALRDARVRFLLCQGAILLAIVPYVAPIVLRAKLIAGVDAPRVGWISDPSIWAPLRTVYQYVFPLRHDRSWASVALNFAAGIALPVVGFLSYAILKRTSAINRFNEQYFSFDVRLLRDKADELLLVGCWFLCPIALPFVLSKVIGPMYVDRYTISAAPALYFLLAVGITSVRRVMPVLISLTTLLILIAPGLRHYYAVDVKMQWREVAAYVDANARKGDILAVAPDGTGWHQKSFEWYHHDNLPDCAMSISTKNGEISAPALAACMASHDRFWLVVPGTDANAQRFKEHLLDYDRNNMRLTREQSFKEISLYLLKAVEQ